MVHKGVLKPLKPGWMCLGLKKMYMLQEQTNTKQQIFLPVQVTILPIVAKTPNFSLSYVCAMCTCTVRMMCLDAPGDFQRWLMLLSLAWLLHTSGPPVNMCPPQLLVFLPMEMILSCEVHAAWAFD